MYFEFYLDDLEIEEPQGFADIVLNIKRDDNWHGVFFEASTSDLGFYGVAYTYLKEKKETLGMKADVTFRALQACGIYEEPEVILEGKLDFGKYNRLCGNSCFIKMPVEKSGCLMTLRNRYDQKVDLDSTVTFSKQSALQQYDKLNFEMELPAKELLASVDGSVAAEGYLLEIDLTSFLGTGSVIFTRPDYAVERFNSIETGQLVGGNNCTGAGDACPEFITPQLLFEDTINCFDGGFPFTSRKKGHIHIEQMLVTSVYHKILKWDGVGDLYNDGELVNEAQIFLDEAGQDGLDTDFDTTISGTTTIENGQGFYAVIEFVSLASSDGAVFQVEYDPETLFTIEANKACPATDANVYAINETLSRITEAITDNCMKVKSDYYGRTDSQPYSSASDGCGGLRVLTSGLKIRRAENAAFFASLKDIFEGLRGIDNIGMSIEDNPFLSGYEWLRIEPVEYFYQDIEILALPYVPEVDESIQEQLVYASIKAGYEKWQVENVNGLDEPNSSKEYRTGLSSVSNPIDITSKLISGSYPIEVTRQQSFAATGAADTTYDNETFIICVERQAYSFIVERGNIDNPANVYSPQTLYNWRIRPFSNLMRWFKSIANSYANISDTDSKLFFSAGAGNFLAEGQLSGTTCKLENGVKAENRDLSKFDFANITEATPLWKPEYATLKYPLSVKDYKLIKARPYGYISYQCGNGEWKKGYVKEIKYQLNKGFADFTLKLKWE